MPLPNIFDNVELKLLDALRSIMTEANSADFCVGYFSLRGWGDLADLAEPLSGDGEECVRVLVGMHRPPHEAMREMARAVRKNTVLDPPTIAQLQKRTSESFKEQLQFGVPTERAEAALRQLARQLRSRKVRIRLFLQYHLHAKLYLVHRTDVAAPLVGYVGSSNLTLAGLSRQGELNVDVLDQDSARKLYEWFEEHWNNKYSIDISLDLAELIESSWASEELISPYLVYLKMIYHLSREARAGEKEFKLPKSLEDVLLDFQVKAVSLAAHHLHVRGGVLLADVVGLGKTLMATAVAKITQEDEGGAALVICPPALRGMWNDYIHKYELAGQVVSLGMVTKVLPDLKRYRLLIIDESHNLRNRDGARYQAIRDYIEENEPRCLLLTATPYNKEYVDIGNQLRLFIDERRDLGVRPERYFQQEDERDFAVSFQAPSRSLMAFEQSPYPEDWRDLLRLYMVRRTREFVIENYAQYDSIRKRHYVTFSDGTRSHFPLRDPKTAPFTVCESDPHDQYARLYTDSVVDVINGLALPRYGLANYLVPKDCESASVADKRIMDDLSRAGKRLMGFCRTNLFKRLESNGHSFLLSLHRHILRNLVAWHALEHGLEVPIGTQDAGMLDSAISDVDTDFSQQDDNEAPEAETAYAADMAVYTTQAAEVYQSYQTDYSQRYKWLPAKFFVARLAEDLLADAKALHNVLSTAAPWDPQGDAKLDALEDLLNRKHPQEKVLIFTQFADTARYLVEQLKKREIKCIEVATGGSSNPTAIARRFSPRSNEYQLAAHETELRVVVATDVLSEGQNLQDAHIVVNFDLPWAIIRLIQRAGRLDRIGQENDTITVYSFMPADGIEDVIHLQSRLVDRLVENQEVVGTDERFFDEGSLTGDKLRDLYTEKRRVLEGSGTDIEVDLVSEAQQIWNNAPEEARKKAAALPAIVYATRSHSPMPEEPAGVLTYLSMPDGTDALVRVNKNGEVVSQSLSSILRAAECLPDTPALEKQENHHELVKQCVVHAVTDESLLGGRLGSRRAVRRKVYERFMSYYETLDRERSLFDAQAAQRLDTVINAIYNNRLTRGARDAFARSMRLGISDEDLARRAIDLYDENRLCIIEEHDDSQQEPEIVCSIGLKAAEGDE